jgi:hypothetical protein
VSCGKVSCKGVTVLLRERKRQRCDPREASNQPDRRDPQPHTETIEPPEQSQNWNGERRGDDELFGETGYHHQQKADGIVVNDPDKWKLPIGDSDPKSVPRLSTKSRDSIAF